MLFDLPRKSNPAEFRTIRGQASTHGKLWTTEFHFPNIPIPSGGAVAGKFCEDVEAMWVEALNFLEFWLPFFQEKGRGGKLKYWMFGIALCQYLGNYSF